MPASTIWGATLSDDEYSIITVHDREQDIDVQLMQIFYSGLQNLVANGDPAMTPWLTWFLGTLPSSTPPSTIEITAGEVCWTIIP